MMQFGRVEGVLFNFIVPQKNMEKAGQSYLAAWTFRSISHLQAIQDNFIEIRPLMLK